MKNIDRFEGRHFYLSNFYPQELDFEGIAYPSLEHAFQAAKSKDLEQKRRIATAGGPRNAKQLGRRIPLRSDWHQIRVQVMERLLRAKFSHPVLEQKLLATGKAYLEEGNTWHDNFWGNCHCPRCVRKKGQNQLGLLLMQIRREMAAAKG